jgi:hypothetical protein
MGGVCLGWEGLVGVGAQVARSGMGGGASWALSGQRASIGAPIVAVTAEFCTLSESRHYLSCGCWNRVALSANRGGDNRILHLE